MKGGRGEAEEWHLGKGWRRGGGVGGETFDWDGTGGKDGGGKEREDLSKGGRISMKQGAIEKKMVWEDVHRKFGTQKKKSVKYE